MSTTNTILFFKNLEHMAINKSIIRLHELLRVCRGHIFFHPTELKMTKDFDKYIENLKAESERGAIPNNAIPIAKFIRVADNIMSKIEEIQPVLNSKKELYDISQQFMLQSRFVSLFTKVIWAHPDAPSCIDVTRCRTKAIEYLSKMPMWKDRMRVVYDRGEWVPDSLYPTLAPVFPVPTTFPTISSPSIISIPFDLPVTFSQLANVNTVRGIETCGILLGATQPASVITTMVIPKQTGTRDTCEALPGAEEAILLYALSNDLVCLGWIHTHPTQSCFLSSVDMHTTLPYQQMLADAVAIVVAPTDTELPIGVWRLTDSGLTGIRTCPLRGFHDHDGKTAFSQLAETNWDTRTSVVVVDMR